MDERSKMILAAVVDMYVDSCEPVGSKALVDEYQLDLSSATVRNVMAALEDEGYLEKPHTSAGRIPSDKGYRAYVDNLLRVPLIPLKKQAKIKEFLSKQIDEMTDLVIRAADYLAEETEFVSIALSPDYRAATLQQLKLVMIESGTALAVIVINAAVVHDRLISVPDLLDASDLNRLANAIESHLKGKSLRDISLLMVTEAAEDTDIDKALVDQVAMEIYASIRQIDQSDIYIDGSHRLLEQPEFQDINFAQRFFHIMHKPHIVAGYLGDIQREDADKKAAESNAQSGEDDSAARKNVEESEASIRIGQEITLDGMEEMSFISTVYHFSPKVSGQLAIIGPKRMRYGEIISQIQFVNKVLSKISEERER